MYTYSLCTFFYPPQCKRGKLEALSFLLEAHTLKKKKTPKNMVLLIFREEGMER